MSVKSVQLLWLEWLLCQKVLLMDRLSLVEEYDAWPGYIAGVERTVSPLLTMVTRHGSINEARD
jgi:hypothetical protein